MEKQVLHHLQGVSRGAGITNSTVTLSGVNMGHKRSWNTNGTLKQGTKFKFLPSFSCHPLSKSHWIFSSAKGAAGSVKCTQVLKVIPQLLSGSPIQACLQALETIHATSFKHMRASSLADAPPHPKELSGILEMPTPSQPLPLRSVTIPNIQKTHKRCIPACFFFLHKKTLEPTLLWLNS